MESEKQNKTNPFLPHRELEKHGLTVELPTGKAQTSALNPPPGPT